MSEIPTFGDALNAAMRGTLKSWGALPWLSRTLLDSGKEFFWDALMFLVALAGPLLFPLSPFLAWIYRRKMRKAIERHKACRERAREAFNSNAQHGDRETGEE